MLPVALSNNLLLRARRRFRSICTCCTATVKSARRTNTISTHSGLHSSHKYNTCVLRTALVARLQYVYTSCSSNNLFLWTRRSFRAIAPAARQTVESAHCTTEIRAYSGLQCCHRMPLAFWPLHLGLLVSSSRHSPMSVNANAAASTLRK